MLGLLMGVKGLKIVVPSTPYDAKGLLLAIWLSLLDRILRLLQRLRLLRRIWLQRLLQLGADLRLLRAGAAGQGQPLALAPDLRRQLIVLLLELVDVLFCYDFNIANIQYLVKFRCYTIINL